MLPLSAELAGHFIGDIAAETITAEPIRTVRLKFAKVSNVLGGDVFDAGKFFEAIHAARFEGVEQLIVAELTSEIAIAPEHASTNAVDKKTRAAWCRGAEFRRWRRR